MSKLRVLVLGAGFGGLELTSILSDALANDLDLTLIDKNDTFFFGFSKLDVMFGRAKPDAVRIPYRNILKSGVQFCQETITAIDPNARRVTTDRRAYEADVLVLALPACSKAAMSSTRSPVPSGCATCCPLSRRAAPSSA